MIVETETFAKPPFSPNFYVPDNRDLHHVPTGSNFNPLPNFGGLILEILNVFIWLIPPKRDRLP